MAHRSTKVARKVFDRIARLNKAIDSGIATKKDKGSKPSMKTQGSSLGQYWKPNGHNMARG